MEIFVVLRNEICWRNLQGYRRVLKVVWIIRKWSHVKRRATLVGTKSYLLEMLDIDIRNYEIFPFSEFSLEKPAYLFLNYVYISLPEETELW